MSTQLLTRSARMNVALFSGNLVSDDFKPTIFKKDNGTVVVQNQAVFRSGTFRDSMGIQSTWEALHIDQMKMHFDLLRERGIFDQIPVRDGHPGWLVSGMEGNGKVMGWHTNLTSTEAENALGKFQVLFADYEITADEYKAKFLAGHFRNRSSEVGEYTSNTEATYWPTYMGVAMVDIPAVEGLNGFSKFSAAPNQAVEYRDEQGRTFHVFMDEREAPPVSGTVNQPPVAPVVPQVPPVPPVQQHTQPQAPAQQVQPFVFKINGNDSTDFTAVQAHVATLEAFRKETYESNVKSFIADLASPSVNKILASQIPSTEAFAFGLTPEQFASWKATFEAAPAQPVLGTYGAQGAPTEGTGASNEQSEDERELVIAEGVVAQHKRGGMTPAQIEQTASYKKMTALQAKLATANK